MHGKASRTRTVVGEVWKTVAGHDPRRIAAVLTGDAGRLTPPAPHGTERLTTPGATTATAPGVPGRPVGGTLTERGDRRRPVLDVVSGTGAVGTAGVRRPYGPRGSAQASVSSSGASRTAARLACATASLTRGLNNASMDPR